MSRRALIVATSRYAGSPLPALTAASADAEGLKQVLEGERIGGFSVTTCLDSSIQQCRLSIEDFFTAASRDDLLLLYVSGHGVKDRDGKLYFALSDTRLDRLLSTGVSADVIHEAANNSPARRIVMIFDTCFSGAFARGLVLKSGAQVEIEPHLQVDKQIHVAEHFPASRGRVIITASDAIQYALVTSPESGSSVIDLSQAGARPDPQAPSSSQGVSAQPSLFTRHLIEALTTGAADLNGDGYVASNELFQYVSSKVTAETSSQNPQRWAFGLDGDDLIIARNPHPRAGRLPKDVGELMEDSRAEVRLLAVDKLLSLSTSESAPLALAA